MSTLRPRRDPLSLDSAFAPILAAAQGGSGTAFEELYRWLAPMVAGYFRAQGSREPEDLTSEVFLGVFRNIRTFSGSRAEFRTWVFSVAHRRLTDERRKWGRRPAIVDPAAGESDFGGPSAPTDVAEEALARMSIERVERLCADLAPAQRDVLLLRLVCDLTVEQVAKATGNSVGGTKALQRRGLNSIQRNLERGVSK